MLFVVSVFMLANRLDSKPVQPKLIQKLHSQWDTDLAVGEDWLEKKLASKKETPSVFASDIIMGKASWDSSPIVVKKFNLVLFTIPKVACTVVKQLARRMQGFPDWARGDDKIPHNPHFNGLTLLRHLPLSEATNIMTNTSWIRAIFMREPKERILSAYLDKVKRTRYIAKRCHLPSQDHKYPTSFTDFLDVIRTCHDSHWMPQTQIMDIKWWPHVNFIGKLHHAADDMQQLLKRVGRGAWADYGATGWGKDGNGAIFHANALPGRATHSKSRYAELYTPAIESRVSDLYKADENLYWNGTIPT
jgi:hypothetical protein